MKQIKRSMADKGEYYLISATMQADLIRSLVKRVGVYSTGYTMTDFDVSTGLMRELGYSETSDEAIRPENGVWFELEDGSSKSDLAKMLIELLPYPSLDDRADGQRVLYGDAKT